jgi:PRTRC genetic system ThiF family protein
MNKSDNKIHLTHSYLLNPIHPVTVSLIGVGGTGSRMLTNLAMIDQALRGLGHLGLNVVAYDDDIVTSANIGRQSFGPSDEGLPKAAVLVNRVNRFYGLNWEYSITKVSDSISGNIIITCVDNKATRKFIENYQQPMKESRHEAKTLYWLDCGNGKDFGQVILSTRYKPGDQFETDLFEENSEITEYSFPADTLKSPSQIFPGVFEGKDDNKPSCSMAEALRKQDLFINPSIAMYASNLLYKLISEGSIDHQGIFINLKTVQTNKLKIS